MQNLLKKNKLSIKINVDKTKPDGVKRKVLDYLQSKKIWLETQSKFGGRSFRKHIRSI